MLEMDFGSVLESELGQKRRYGVKGIFMLRVVPFKMLGFKGLI